MLCFRIYLLLSLVMAILAPNLIADDGAASIAAGGIVVMKREPRIVMAKEVLQISAKKVIVDYDFRNDSEDDITTEVAFPIPDYGIDYQQELSRQAFDDFHLWIEGTPAAFQTETHALLNDKDYTQLLTSLQIDIASFGHVGRLLDNYPDIHRLPETKHHQLGELGLIDLKGDQALWVVRKKYHWNQTFPAHKTVHIRHEYTPVFGNSNGFQYAFSTPPSEFTARDLKSFCLDEQLSARLASLPNSADGGYSYVDFILTSANTWRTPIEDFTLIVERPHPKNNRGESETNYVSFCWDGPVTKIDGDHFSAHAVNLVPRQELRVGFITVEPH